MTPAHKPYTVQGDIHRNRTCPCGNLCTTEQAYHGLCESAGRPHCPSAFSVLHCIEETIH